MSHRPKKKYGQHFLTDGNIIRRILEAAAISPDHHILEIGPGMGALTDHLLEQADLVQVMEIDTDLIETLKNRQVSNLRVHGGDALKLNWRELLDQPPYTLVANLPYNVSTQIVFRLLEHHDLFRRMVLMFQKEVGERLMAQPGTKDYGILSVLCRQWFDIATVVRVKPGCFFPPPKVDSIVVQLRPLETPRVPVADDALLKRLVKAAFGQRRKTLRNSLRSANLELDRIDGLLQNAGIDPKRRGETLSLEEFACLTNLLCG